MSWILKDLDTDEILKLENGDSFGRCEGKYNFPANSNMSRIHCKIEIQNGYVFIIDLDSYNGTYVNSEKCLPHQKKILSDNAILVFAGKSFLVKNTVEVVLRSQRRKSA
jgi:pSer/pThr/pTyr-binding forkhead associated (FHA) protein